MESASKEPREMLPRKNLRVAIYMMQKDEDDNLKPWLDYHIHLFGAESLFIWDNGSTSQKCINILREYEALGINVDYSKVTGNDFRQKGVIYGHKIKEHDEVGKFDIHIPLDCDEFIAVENEPGQLELNPSAVAAELSKLAGEERALCVQWAYYNVLGHKSHFWRYTHQKTFFCANTFKWMDHGYHIGETKAGGRRESRIVHLHYHYKPHAVIVEHSKNKLRPTHDIDDPAVLRAECDKGNRLALFICGSEENYMKKFTTENSFFIPSVPAAFEVIGSQVPFSNSVFVEEY